MKKPIVATTAGVLLNYMFIAMCLCLLLTVAKKRYGREWSLEIF